MVVVALGWSATGFIVWRKVAAGGARLRVVMVIAVGWAGCCVEVRGVATVVCEVVMVAGGRTTLDVRVARGGRGAVVDVVCWTAIVDDAIAISEVGHFFS